MNIATRDLNGVKIILGVSSEERNAISCSCDTAFIAMTHAEAITLARRLITDVEISQAKWAKPDVVAIPQTEKESIITDGEMRVCLQAYLNDPVIRRVIDLRVNQILELEKARGK